MSDPSLEADVRQYRKTGDFPTSNYARQQEILRYIEASKTFYPNEQFREAGISFTHQTLDRTTADIVAGKRSVPTSQLNPEQQHMLNLARLNERAIRGEVSPAQYVAERDKIGETQAQQQHERTIESARRAAPGLQAAAQAERERFANIGMTNFSAQSQAHTKQLEKVNADIERAGFDSARLVQSVGRANPRRDLKITSPSEIEQNLFARQETFRTVSSAKPKPVQGKTINLSLSEGLNLSGGQSMSAKKETQSSSITPISFTVPKYEQPVLKSNGVQMSFFPPPPKKKLTRGEGRYKGTSRLSDADLLTGAVGKVNQKSDIFRKSQQIKQTPAGIKIVGDKTVLEPPRTVDTRKFGYGAAFVQGSEALVKNPTFQDITKFSNISLKGTAAKILNEKNKPEISIADAKIIPGTLDYVTSKDKQPLVLYPYERQLDPLRNRADLIETVQRPILNLGNYIIGSMEATKRIIQTGDPLAGEKYYEKEVSPKLKETASSRLFSNPSELFDIRKLPENLISAGTEIAMYAFMGGGKLGRSTGKKEPPAFVEPPPPISSYVPQNAYRTRRVPRDIFKEDTASPIKFTQTKISLGRGTGIKFDPSSGGISINKSPPSGKPPSTFTGTKIELGKGTGRPPTTQIVTKGRQILLQQQKLTKRTTLKEQPFTKTTVKLGEAETKIIKQIQSKNKPELYPLQTPKKKKPTAQTSEYIVQQEVIRYPPSTQKQGLQFKDEIYTKLIPQQKESQKFKDEFAFIVTPKQKQALIPQQKESQKFKDEFAFIVTPKQTSKLVQPLITPQQFTFQQPTPKEQPFMPQRGFIFPPLFPSAFFGAGGYQDPSSLKKAFAAYGISSDINIKTLPTYSRYSAGPGIFKAQAKEDKRIQELFYGKPRRKSRKKSRKR